MVHWRQCENSELTLGADPLSATVTTNETFSSSLWTYLLHPPDFGWGAEYHIPVLFCIIFTEDKVCTQEEQDIMTELKLHYNLGILSTALGLTCWDHVLCCITTNTVSHLENFVFPSLVKKIPQWD